jgi:DNA-binding CsgD family transcriptional regulator
VVGSVVSDANEFRAGRTIDLSRLNDSERRVLRLLAEGHTAKSISNLVGSTPLAINERLREARRKTGVGSSRELARLLRSQENRHNQIGMVSRPRSSPADPLIAADPWRPQTGVIAMIAIFLITAAGAVALMTEPPTSTFDPLYRGVMAEQDDPVEVFTSPKTRQASDQMLAGEGSRAMLRSLYAKVRSEPQDPAWASVNERALRALFSAIPHIGVPGTELKVLCATKVCEVAGTIDTTFASSENDLITELNRGTMPRLNPRALSEGTDRLKLKSIVGTIGQTSEKPPRQMFLFYYAREP